MASSMSPELQKTFENTWAYEMNQQLKEMFQAKASKERLDVVKSLMACKLKPEASICAFVLEMKGYFDRLESLNMMFDAELSINIILSGIKKIDVPSTSSASVLTVGHNAKKINTFHSNWKGKAAKGKSDCGSNRKAESEIAPTNDPKEAVYLYCNTKGHWKRSCPKHLKDLKDGKVEKGSHSGMFMIELHNTTTSNSWVLDTGCGTHICTVLQGLKESRRLKHIELNLVMGKRKITPVTRIGKYELMLKSGVRIDLNNCHYSLEMTRNIISFHALFKDGYKFSFDKENRDILVYLNGCFMFKASPCKGIYETAECISHNGNVILNVGSSNELDKSKLSHLGHVNKKRIAQLQKDEMLESFDFKSDDVCECCLLGNMTKSPFIGSCKRGEGLLDLVHTDVCGPFRSATKHGKRYYLNPPRTPQLNGVAKWRNRTMLDMVRSMMSQATLPISLWGYALETTTHILNLVPTKKVSKTPFETWKGKQESYGYLFYKPKDNVVFVARRGVFLEREMLSKEDSESKIDLEEIQESADEEPIVNTDTQQEVVTLVKPDDISLPIRRTSGRVSKPPQFYYGFHIEEDKIIDSTLSKLDEPANYKEAMASPKAAKRKEAMKSEIQSMYDNQVWNLVDTTPSLKTVGCKWIFKKKGDTAGWESTPHIYRIMLAIAAFHDYEIWQMDVKTAFLNGKLTEDVFMAQPKGFENAKYPKRVCKLQKAIYGLKQASLAWKISTFRVRRSVMYAMTCTRPDVSFSLSMVSRHQQNPGEGHWRIVKNILKYLRNTKDRFLVYSGEEELRVTGYCDASCKIQYRSRSTYEFQVILQFCELSKEANTDERNSLEIFIVVPTIKSKHIERKYHFVRSKVEEGHVIVKHIRSEDNPADPFIKALSKSRHDEHARSIGLKDNIKF
ncbi:retrotransposon protein, putative, ty1-copia subclass [Tanacetum coccineum]